LIHFQHSGLLSAVDGVDRQMLIKSPANID